MKTTIRIIGLAVALLCAAACDSSVLYDESHRVDEAGWHLDDRLVYNIKAEDTTQSYLCCLDIRNTTDYPFSNIYLSITTIYPNGEVAVDTNIEFVLAAPDGTWLGKASGRYVDGRYPFCHFRFPEVGNYQFIVGHAMRDTLLRGVKDVGMYVEREQ